MTILERLLQHDAWTTRALLTLSENLSDSSLDREFDIGHRSLRRTLVHIVANMECWCDLMTGQSQRSERIGAPSGTISELTDRLNVVAAELQTLGRIVEKEHREDDCFVDSLDNPPRRKPIGAGLVHISTHGMHHRSQCLYMMRNLGVPNLIEGDALSWELNHMDLQDWPLA